MTSLFSNLEDVVSAFVDMTEVESNAMFAQGDVIVEAVKQGFGAKATVKACAAQAKRSERTVWRRYDTAFVFAPEQRNPEMFWGIHALCAKTNDPFKWLALAADEHWSTRELEDAIAAAGDKVAEKPEFILKSVECNVYANADGTFTVVPGEGEYKVTIVQGLTALAADEISTISQIQEVA